MILWLKRWLIRGFIVGVLLMAGFAVFVYYVSFNKIEVRNSASVQVDDVRLSLVGDNGVVIDREWAWIPSGESAILRHRINGSFATLNFRIGDKGYSYESGTIDLWTGQTWLLEITDSGKVTGQYNFERH